MVRSHFTPIALSVAAMSDVVSPSRRLPDLLRALGLLAIQPIIPAIFFVSWTLGVMQAVLGDRQAVVGLEVTKMFEEFARGTFSELIAHFEREPIRGEVTLMVRGS